MTLSNKDKYGEVFTPENLIHIMINDAIQIMGHQVMKQTPQNVFEIGAGKGAFYDTLVLKRNLMCGTYVMNEINEQHRSTLEELPSTQETKKHLLLSNLFSIDTNKYKEQFDLVWGNLPFHNGGKSFVPGIGHGKGYGGVVTIWPQMVHFSFDVLLKTYGFFYAIIPCIWLKEDKAGIYDLFVRKHKICFLRIFNCKQANRIFQYNCQTPVCYVMVQKMDAKYTAKEVLFNLYDSAHETYIKFHLLPGFCIPTSHVHLFRNRVQEIQNHKPTLNCYDKILRTSYMKKSVLQHSIQSFHKNNAHEVGHLQHASTQDANGQTLYKVITGASLDSSNDNAVLLHGIVSLEHGAYYGIPKLILPHKRFLKYFKDYDGTYSVYGRDMHVFLFPTNPYDMDILASHLESHKDMVEDGFRIRMNFIEKYAFKYISYPF